MITISEVGISHSAKGKATYRIELAHAGLKKHRIIQSDDLQVLQRKSELQIRAWEEVWLAARAKEDVRRSKENHKHQLDANKKAAAERTSEARREQEALLRILAHTLDVNDAVDWESLKDTSPFLDAKPSQPIPSSAPRPLPLPPKPDPDAQSYRPKLGLLDKLISSRSQALTAAARASWEADYATWSARCTEIASQNDEARRQHALSVTALDEAHAAAIAEWERRKEEFLSVQNARNTAVENRKALYLAGEPSAIVDYCDMVLSSSKYPDCFPQEFALDFQHEAKTLVVEYALPAPDLLPKTKEVKYSPTRDEFSDLELTPPQAEKVYDEVLYQVVLRTIHELFEADVVKALDAITFNGIVTSIDRRSGRQVTACVLSLHVRREEFLAINLRHVDPKACFKALKGVGSAKLHSLSPVPPIMTVRRFDGRFIAAQEVAHTLDESSNLATMDWQEFEHLIREVFAKEFSSAGSEVNVTRASRDGGVDAIAFDPDPIRGGKIVIQAKRYANTVAVSAVRDLYGTVLNEGANKGVLVTTSDYGPDAYEFAKDKPIVLLNGGNLLHMLERHGHRAHIDLKAARLAARGAATTE